jgi:rod shape determining protein RodA
MSVLSVEKSLFTKQALLLGIGFVPFMIAFTIPPAIWQRLSWLLYMINVGMLLLVMFMGNSKGGAQRWIDIGPIGFQPSEMSKFLTVLTVTTFFVHRGDDLRSFSTLLLSLLHVIPVVLLIAIQPHYAAAASVLVGWIAVAIVVRVNCGASGQGYLQGEFKGAAFVPEQENDLIFSVIGQEWGFAGSIFLLTLYLVFFLRGWQLCLKMEDLWSRSVCLALLAVMAFHWTVNMAMNLGIGPVIGLWLPFISYGGTALWVCLMMVGLILNLNSIQSEEQFSRGAPKAWMR